MITQCKRLSLPQMHRLTDEATARTHVFANADFSSGTSGSTTTGMSSAACCFTIDTTANLNLRIMGIVG